MSRSRSAGHAVRYASRQTGVDFEKWLTWGALAGGLWIAFKIYKSVTDVAGAAGDAAARAYVAATTRPVEVLHSVVLPNGQKVPLQSLRINAKDFTFMSGNVKYKLTGRRPDNNYDAVKV